MGSHGEKGKCGRRVLKPLPPQDVRAPLGTQPDCSKTPAKDPVDHCNVTMSYNCTVCARKEC